MASQVVDARGRSCPEPVIMTKKALDALASGTIRVLVDSESSRCNVVRFAENSGYKVKVADLGEEFQVDITK